MATITVKNIDKLTLKLNAMATMELRDTMTKAVTIVHGQAKSLAPVDTGNLAGSIRMKVKLKKDTLEGRVYTNTQYAPYVEFGTGVKGNGSYPYDIDGLQLAYHESWGGMKAQPYMYPALKQNEKVIKDLFKQGVKTKLKKCCKGGK